MSSPEVLPPVPLHRGAVLKYPVARRAVALGVERRVDHRVDQQLRGGLGPPRSRHSSAVTAAR